MLHRRFIHIIFCLFCCTGLFGSEAYQVLGLGAPIVDILIPAEDSFVASLPGDRGGSAHADWPTFSRILEYSKTRDSKKATGGSCSIVMKGLTNLGHKAAILGKIGTDENGAYFLNRIQPMGITPLFTYSETPTAQVASLVTPDHQRTMRCFPGASTEFTQDEVLEEYFQSISLIHIEGYNLYTPGVVQRAVGYAKKHGILVSFDLSSFEVVKKFKKEILEILPDVDILFANEDEALTLTGLDPEHACNHLRSCCRVSIVSIGKDGCWVGSTTGIFNSPAIPVDVIDTTGAGDLFAAGFLHGYLSGKPLETCAFYGNLTGSVAVQIWGTEIPPELWESIIAQMK
jgi:sugar/nucleoside kinase (ribokinase family)